MSELYEWGREWLKDQVGERWDQYEPLCRTLAVQAARLMAIKAAGGDHERQLGVLRACVENLKACGMLEAADLTVDLIRAMGGWLGDALAGASRRILGLG